MQTKLFKRLEKIAAQSQKNVLLPESYDDRILEATEIIHRKKIARITLFKTSGKTPSTTCRNIDMTEQSFIENFIEDYRRFKRKNNPDLSVNQVRKELNNPLTLACILLKSGYADAVVAGSVYSTSEVLRNAINIVGTSDKNKTVSSFFLMTFHNKHEHKDKILAFADCGVIPHPDSKQLSDIAIQTASSFNKLTGKKPRVAFLSFSTKGSAKHPSIERIIQACRLTKKKMPQLICDCELQFDAAFVPEIARRKNLSGPIKGDANVFIFPDLNSGNIAYKISERIGGATATGPVLQGLAKPVMDLSRGCNVRDIVNMVTVACCL